MKNALNKKAAMRLATAGLVVLGLTAPALADHFDWTATPPEGTEAAPITAEDAHVTCPEPAEGEDAAAAQAECDAAVAQVAKELTESDHPENHGKYVSFTAHCLKGMKGKGQKMKMIAQASEEEQMGLAVALCSESRLSASEEAAQKEKGGDSEEEEAAVEGADAEDSDENAGDKKKSRGKGKGKGKRK